MGRRILLYDADCPLCVWYTGAFVRWGWMQEQERVPWDEMPAAAADVVDMDRSRHEIALFDLETHQVWYGIDSLLAVLGRRAPIVERVGRLPLLNGALRLLYQLITYNRKIIAGKTASDCKGTCNPDFHAGWRAAYIGLAFVLGLGLLRGWMSHLSSSWATDAWTLVLLVMVSVPGALILVLPGRRAWDLAGHAATVGLVVGAALLPLQWVVSSLEAGEGMALAVALGGASWGGYLLVKRTVNLLQWR